MSPAAVLLPAPSVILWHYDTVCSPHNAFSVLEVVWKCLAFVWGRKQSRPGLSLSDGFFFLKGRNQGCTKRGSSGRCTSLATPTFRHTSRYNVKLPDLKTYWRIGEWRYSSIRVLKLGAGGGWVISITPRPLYPRYPLDRRLRRPQSRSGREIRTPDVQSIAQ
jgi:hypothetical protein